MPRKYRDLAAPVTHDKPVFVATSKSFDANLDMNVKGKAIAVTWVSDVASEEGQRRRCINLLTLILTLKLTIKLLKAMLADRGIGPCRAAALGACAASPAPRLPPGLELSASASTGRGRRGKP